ncbi:hypothetical protein ACE1SV_25740 [Streptomyces sennicomposti]
MEICIAVADWARGLMTWVLDVPGGEGTDARRRKRPRHVRNRAYRVSPSGSTGASITGSTAGPTVSGPEAGMVVGWG